MPEVQKTRETKKLHIQTWGCQMNTYDSDRMADLLRPLGYDVSDNYRDADLVILNTCHIREKAAEKLFSELGRVRRRQEQQEKSGMRMMIGVAGCVAQAEGEQILKRAPYVDLVFGPQTYHRLPEMVAKALRQRGGVVDTEFPEDSKFDALPQETSSTGPSAFLSVQEGCDKFCTFCVVPYTRGAEYSRPVEAVLAEARRYAQNGSREIFLLGQNVNAYHGAAPDSGTWSLARLIRAIAEIKGVERIRFTTSHPRDMDGELIAAHAEVAQLMPFIHLPAQSGSNIVLEAMNRRHKREDYLRTVEKLRIARTDIALSSDFIVGFPGETDKDFEDTLALVCEVDYAQAYSFKYSPRPGTPAAGMARQVPEAVKAARLQQLQELLGAQQRRFNESCIGKTLPVLFDRKGRQDGQLLGRTPYMQAVHVDDAVGAFGTITDVVVASATLSSLAGRLQRQSAC